MCAQQLFVCISFDNLHISVRAGAIGDERQIDKWRLLGNLTHECDRIPFISEHVQH